MLIPRAHKTLLFVNGETGTGKAILYCGARWEYYLAI